MQNILVSLYLGYTNPVPQKSITLFEYFTDDTHKKTVEYIRTLTDKKEITKLKSKLPAITVSGLFQTRHAIGLINHSGYICIDIDGGDNPHISDFNMLRDEFKKCLNVAYAALSVSGKGVFCLIPLKEPEKHKEHFEALKIIFKTFGITIDKGCGDVTRLRGYSYDPDAYFNKDAVTFTQTVEHQAKSTHTRPPKAIINTSHNKIGNSSNKAGNNTHNRVMKIITEINSKGIDITESYHDWFQIACALANEFGESGRDMFLLVSQNNPGYNPDAADNLFSECLQRNYPITIGTFFHLAGAHGLK
jgi:hypothetical protein